MKQFCKMNKLVFLCLIVGLCKTIDAYCVNKYEPVACGTPCACPNACPTTNCITCPMPNPCPTSTCMSCPASNCMSCNTCPVSDCMKTYKNKPCDSGCMDLDCKCLKAMTNFPEVEYPMPSCGCSRTYYY